MILVRNVFQLKFGMARQAVALWKEGMALMTEAGFARDLRVLTDLTGPSYTLVMEGTFESLADFEKGTELGHTRHRWPVQPAAVSAVRHSPRFQLALERTLRYRPTGGT